MKLCSWQDFTPYYAALSDVDKHCFGNSAWNWDTWEKLFKNRQLFVNLEFHDGDPAGFCVVTHTSGEGELLRIGVKSELRRQGLGHRLLENSIQELREHHVVLLFLEVRADNEAAVLFYRYHGFTLTGQRTRYYSEPPCDAHLYSLSIEKNRAVSIPG